MKSQRLWIMGVAAIAVIAWYFFTDPNGGAETMARLQWLAWIFVIGSPVYLMRRAFHPEARSGAAYRKAMEHPIGAGLVFLGLSILTGLLFVAFSGRAIAGEPPAAALKYLPTLQDEISTYWGDVPLRSALAAQVEQETCPSLKSTKCWNPRAELKTNIEYGFGLGQLTVTSRFDNFLEARKLDASLHDWQYSDRWDPAKQLRTMVLMDRSGFSRLSFIPDSLERLSMAFSGYNGGIGGVLADRRLCASIAGCDPNKWFGNVEFHSLKSTKAKPGYGQSNFDINRGYVRAVMNDRRTRYAQWFGEAERHHE